MSPNILILGKNYSTALGVIRSLGIKGYSIEAYYITNEKGSSEEVAASKYVKKCTEFIGRIDEEIVADILEKYSERKHQYVIIPTDDYSASLIDRYRDKLQPYFLMPYIKDGEVGDLTTLMDKSVQSRLAKDHGMNVVKDWIISLQDDIKIPEDISYPCFVKPLLSAKGFKVEIGVCASEEELKEKLVKLKATNPERAIMVQEFLNIKREYSMSGLCVDDTIILPALIKKIVVGKRERGVSIVGELIRFEELGDIKEQLMEILKSIHYVGMFDIDLMEADGKIYFGELNLRSSGTGYAVQLAGVNLPDMFVRALTGDDTWKEENQKVKYGLRFFYDKTAWEDYQSGHITKKQLLKYQEMSDYSLLLDDNDKIPGRIFLRKMKVKILKKKVRGLAKKIIKRKGR